MKRLVYSAEKNNPMLPEMCNISLSEVVDLLSSLPELQNSEISLETEGSDVVIVVGDNRYNYSVVL